jgi:hypothetical protein
MDMHHAPVQTLSPHQPATMADSYRFERAAVRSQRLPPHGQLRAISAIVSGTTAAARAKPLNHTLFFSSLLGASLYQETIVTHYATPTPGRHGPFNIAEMSPADYGTISASDLIERTETHLAYQRMGSAPIETAQRTHVLNFVSSLAERNAQRFMLLPGARFSEIDNPDHAHEWSHALLEFHEYLVFEPARRRLLLLMFAFD